MCTGSTVVMTATCGRTICGQRRDLARVVHADLEHAEGAVGRHARQRQRHAPVVVVGLLGRVRRPRQAQAVAQHLLGAGLADAAGDGNDAPVAAGARGAADAFQRPQRIVDAQQRAAGVAAVHIAARHDGRGRPGLEGSWHELVPVARILQGDEHVAGLEAARVDGEAGDGAARACHRLRRAPQPPGQPIATGAQPSDRGLRQGGAHRLVIRERQHGRADDLPGLVALAGDQQHVALAEQARAGADRLGPVADLACAGAAGQDLGADGRGVLAARIVVGDDDVVGEARRRCGP